jgi:ubiquinone biosynthesis protein
VKTFDLLSHAGRAKDILSVLAKHGFADLIGHLDLPAGWQRLLPQPAVALTTHERLRLAAEELGPAFVKLGQFLSMRPDVLPQPLILELRKLQSNVSPLPFEKIKPVLVASLGGEPEVVFSAFDETPLASASLAQVYAAQLRDGDRPVAVKIQKPDIRHTMEIDLDFATWLAEQLHQRSDTLRPFNLPAVVAEARQGMLAELDFRNEARNQQYFNIVNPHSDQVFAPTVYSRHSGEHVLVMDRIEGENVAAVVLDDGLRREIAGRGALSLVRQVLIDGFSMRIRTRAMCSSPPTTGFASSTGASSVTSPNVCALRSRSSGKPLLRRMPNASFRSRPGLRRPTSGWTCMRWRRTSPSLSARNSTSPWAARNSAGRWSSCSISSAATGSRFHRTTR